MEKATEPAVRRCYYSRWSGAKESYTRQLQPYILARSGGSGEDLGGSGRYRRRLPAKLSSSPVSPPSMTAAFGILGVLSPSGSSSHELTSMASGLRCSALLA